MTLRIRYLTLKLRALCWVWRIGSARYRWQPVRRLRKHRPSELGNKLGEASLEMAVSLYALADTLSALSCSKALSCRFAKAAHRIYGSTAVVFFKTIAYLDLPDENNKPYLARCSLREQVARAIAEWDQPGGTMKPGSYYLYPPTPGRTMAAMVARDRATPRAVKLAKQAKATAKRHANNQNLAVRGQDAATARAAAFDNSRHGQERDAAAPRVQSNTPALRESVKALHAAAPSSRVIDPNPAPVPSSAPSRILATAKATLRSGSGQVHFTTRA
jgi:hypothetical protein